MDSIIIRHIDEFDPGLIRDLCRLEIENLGEEASINQWVIPVLIRYGLFTIAERQQGNEIVGVCQVIRSYKEPFTAFIHSFYVIPQLRGKHIGSMILTEVLKKVRYDGLKRIKLTVDPNNMPAISLYRSAGFNGSSILKNEYGEGVDRVLYSLEL